jgi:hypothetical protein
MAEGKTISAAQLFSDDASEFFIDAGVPRYNRRLTDKVLAAFNHAYAMGEMDLARRLWECLVEAEKIGQQYQRRRPNQALDLAAEWVAFVDARDRYREASRQRPVSPEEASEAFRRMRDAYQNWRARNGEIPPSVPPELVDGDEADDEMPPPPTQAPSAHR